MGWFDGSSSSHHDKHDKHHRSSSKHHSSSASLLGAITGDSHHRSSSRHRSSGSIFGSGDHKHNSSRSSIFGGGDHKHNSSRSSFFGGFGSGRSSSYYKRSPRGGFMKRAYSKLRRLLRDLMYYMKRNPMKVFMLVIMPLITGGALAGLLRKFGIRLPPAVQKMMGGGAGVGHGKNGAMQFERSSTHAEGPMGGMGGAIGGLGSAVGAMGGIGSAMKMAKMFM
ncbi:hypothetical protein BGZ60DRAFT_518297 [Tricladium varicosporioides]|nr:hypothetical protein BGZ60DRAFT_518297 [Hymenoscyphus varicosporioides]